MGRMGRAGIGTDVEGVHAVEAAVRAGRAQRLFVEESRVDSLRDVIAAATANDVPIEYLDDVRPMASTSSPQGVVARCRPLSERSIDELIAVTDPTALLVLDHLEDPRNVGAVARSAAAAGIGGLVMSARRAAPLSAAAFKAAAGTLEHLPVAVVGSIAQALDRLRRGGVWVVGLDSTGDTELFGLGLLTEPVAVVVGAEGAGLGHLVAQRCDVVARIPLAKGVESLNASVAASLAAFEVARARR